MITMKIVVHQNRDTRRVINTGFEEQLIVFSTCSEPRSRTVSTLSPSRRSRYNAFRGTPKTPRNRYTAAHKEEFQRNERDTRKKFAKLSVGTQTQQDGSIKNSVDPSAIQLREPVFQFLRSNERVSSPESSANIGDASSSSTEKTDYPTDSMIEHFKCRMCPNFAVPEVYECPCGHSVCDECYLVVGHCTLCPNESSFRRVLGMERIAACLKFPCRWQQRGCLQLLGPAAWRDHVDSCSHAEVHLKLALASASSNSYEIESNEDAIDL